MQFFKPVHNPWQHDIQCSVKDLLTRIGPEQIMTKTKDVSWWYNNVSGLEPFLSSLGVHHVPWVMFAFINPQTKSMMHVDINLDTHQQRAVGINIPIQNTHNTAMVWYDHVRYGGWKDLSQPHLPHVAGYGRVPRFYQGTQLCELELLDTNLVRTDCPHRVIHNGTDIRYILSVGAHDIESTVWPEFEPAITYSAHHFFTLPPETECVFFPGDP